ncbi:MAG: hypothetical protein J7601_11565 [Chloroflexi bacterium]|jgi:hypothetical protein|nr:hypothetical protein [Chloroflexota bacterium]
MTKVRYRLYVTICGLQRLEADGTLTPLDPVDSSFLLESVGLAEWLPLRSLTRKQYAELRRLRKRGIYPVYETLIQPVARRKKAKPQPDVEPDPRLEALRREAYRERLTAIAERGWITSDARDDLNYAWLFSDNASAGPILELLGQLDANERVELSPSQRQAILKVCEVLK